MSEHHRSDSHEDSTDNLISNPIFQNISEAEYRRLQEELRETQAQLKRYRNLYEKLPSIYFTLNPEGVILAINPFGAARLGYRAEELTEKPIFSVIHPEDRESFQANLTNLLQHQILIENLELRQLRQDGSILWVKVTAHVVAESDTNPLILLICEDVTEPKRVKEEMQKFVSLVENSSDFIATSSLEGKIIFVNKAGCELVGLESLEEALAKSMSDYFTEEGWVQFCEITQPAMIAAGQWEGESQLRHFKTGQLIDVQRSCFVVKHPQSDQPLCLATIQRDITKRKRVEAALQKQSERQQLMAAITQRIRQSLNLPDILTTTVAQVREFLQTDRVFLYRFEPDWSGVIVVESAGAEWKPLLGSKIKDCYFAKGYTEAYKNGRIQATDDIYAAGLSQCHIDFLAELQVRATLVVPVLQNEGISNTSAAPAVGEREPGEESAAVASSPQPKAPKLWGLLVANHCSAPRQWQQFEIDLLKQLATHVALAIQQSELYEQVQRLNAELECQVRERTGQLQQSLDFEAMLKRVTDKVRDSLDESQILQTTVRELSLVLGVDACDTALYDAERTTSVISYECILTPRVPAAKGQVVRMADFPEGYSQLLKGRYFQFCEVVPSLRGPLTILACPIFDNEGVLGDMWLFKQREDSFNELEIRLVQQVANQCAIAIRQARLFQAAQAQVEELEKLNRLKDDFLSTISHEFRTPMSNMKLALQMLELAINQKSVSNLEMVNSPAGSPHTSRYLQILKDEFEREISLINDLLDLVHLNAGTQPLILTPIHLNNWIPHVIERFEKQFQTRHQNLRVEISSELPTLLSDMSSLGRILSELLNNAYKYTPLHGEITVMARAESGRIQLSVINTGIEISASELPRIFDQFYRIPNPDPWKQGGTGLGLALAKKLAEHLGGKLQVESGEGQTCFTLELPVNAADV